MFTELSNINYLMIGAVIGFLFSIFILDMLYRTSMKIQIDKIHKNYCKALEILKSKYEKGEINNEG